MLITFINNDLEDLYKLPVNQLGKQKIARDIIIGYRKRLEILANANDLSEISVLRGMNLEKLKGKDYRGCYSVRVNGQYRIIFKEVKGGIIEVLVIELSKHYEK